MTQIIYGDIEDVLEYGRSIGRLVEAWDDKKANELIFQWNSFSLENEVLVFINPSSKINPKDLYPREDRHILFLKDSISVTWLRWAKENNLSVKLCQTSEIALISILSEHFEKRAAIHLIRSNPGGVVAVKRAVALFDFFDYDCDGFVDFFDSYCYGQEGCLC